MADEESLSAPVHAVVIWRLCAVGDTVRTVRPMSEYDGRAPNQHLRARCTTEIGAIAANNLIRAGRWEVIHCGQCDKPVVDCRCDYSVAQHRGPLKATT